MKTRAGFVSNSSTASFVLVGFLAPSDLNERMMEVTGTTSFWAALKELAADWLDGEQVNEGMEGVYIGFELSRWDQHEGDCPRPHEQRTSLSEVMIKLDALRIRLGIESLEFEIICGVKQT